MPTTSPLVSLILACNFSAGPLPVLEERSMHSCYPFVCRSLSPFCLLSMSLLKCPPNGPFIAAFLSCKLSHCTSEMPVRSKCWSCPWTPNSCCLRAVASVLMYKYVGPSHVTFSVNVRIYPVMLHLGCFPLSHSILLLFWGCMVMKDN